MKNPISQLTLAACKLQSHHIRMFMMVLALASFVIGAGAPESGGGIGQ